MDDFTAPHWETAALVTIDVQQDTLDGQPLEIPGTSAILPRVADLCEAFRSANAPIAHIVRLYQPDGSNAELSRKELVRQQTPLLRPGTPGRRLAPGLFPDGAPDLDDQTLLAGGVQTLGSGEVAIYKPRWGAFFSTPLDSYLRSENVDTIVFAGCNFPNCPRTSVYQASERDYRIALADDAVSGLYERGANELRNIGVHVLSTEAITDALTARSLI